LPAGPFWPGLTRLPRLVARGYPAAVLGRSRCPWCLSTTKAGQSQAPRRDQFVILIGGPVHMQQTTGTGPRPCAWAPRPRRQASVRPWPDADRTQRP